MLRTIGVYPSAPSVLRLNTTCVKPSTRSQERAKRAYYCHHIMMEHTFFTKWKRTFFDSNHLKAK